MNLQITPRADAELEEATLWYLDRGVDLGDRFTIEVERVIRRSSQEFAERSSAISHMR